MAVVVTLLFVSSDHADRIVRNKNLPARIDLKSARETFTWNYDFALKEGRVWMRVRHDGTTPGDPWQLLEGTGLPVYDFEPPERIKSMSADGENLILLSDSNRIYYLKLYNGGFRWQGRGIRDANFWKQLHLPPNLAWSVSHRNIPYTDIDGNIHPARAGVTSIYMLSSDGLEIHYADPWLPDGFRYRICGPDRGRFRMVGLSASASTILVIGVGGEMATRLIDFDIVGENPFLRYTFHRLNKRTKKMPRRLPAEEWRREPGINGRITNQITIFKTGDDNLARELRVEGFNAAGEAGYYRKKIRRGNWTFVPTGRRPVGELIAPDKKEDLFRTKQRGINYKTEYFDSRLNARVRIRVKDFQSCCSPNTFEVTLNDQHKVTLQLFVYQTRGPLSYVVKDGSFTGRLVIPGQPERTFPPLLNKFITRHLAGQNDVDIDVRQRSNALFIKDDDCGPDFSWELKRE